MPPSDLEAIRRFGNALRLARRNAGMSLDRLADEMKARGYRMTGANIGSWERGVHGPKTREPVAIIEDILEITDGRLHEAMGWRRGGTTVSQDYNSRIVNLPPEAQAVIDTIIEAEERKLQG